jgi:hypothetical protein
MGYLQHPVPQQHQNISTEGAAPEWSTGLFKYFTSISRGEHLEQIQHENEMLRDRQVDMEELEQVKAHKKALRQRELARERKRRQRERQGQVVRTYCPHEILELMDP